MTHSFLRVMLSNGAQVRIYEQTMTTLPPNGSDELQLILAASKCLDLLLVLQTEEFQM